MPFAFYKLHIILLVFDIMGTFFSLYQLSMLKDMASCSVQTSLSGSIMTSIITHELLGCSIIYLSRKYMKGPNVFMTEEKQVSRKRNTIFYGLSQYAQASWVKWKPLHKIHLK